MNSLLGIGTNYFVFAGKTTVYAKDLPKSGIPIGGSSTSQHLSDVTFPTEWIAKNGHIECVAINKDDNIIAVGDSMRGLHVFKLEGLDPSKWVQIMNESSNKRVIKLQFTSDGRFLTFLDKQGDIYALKVPTELTMSPVIKKIMGHTSFISDYATRIESNQIVSCDRDEKIRISNFPDAFVIQGFKLGHTESVINVIFVEITSDDGETKRIFLLSISLTGILGLWDFDKPVVSTESDYVKTWNIKSLLPQKMSDAGVKLMKAVNIGEKICLSVLFTGSTKIYVFRVSVDSLEINFQQELETDSENVLMEWSSSAPNSGTLLVYTPELDSIIRWWHSSEKTLRNYEFGDLPESTVLDIKASTDGLKPVVVPMKKRVTTFEDATAILQEQHTKKVKV